MINKTFVLPKTIGNTSKTAMIMTLAVLFGFSALWISHSLAVEEGSNGPTDCGDECAPEVVTVCHYTGSDSNPYETIHINYNGLNGHFSDPENQIPKNQSHQGDIWFPGEVECPTSRVCDVNCDVVLEEATIIAHKIVCDDESYLPNGRDSLSFIDQNTAIDFLSTGDNKKHCYLEDWEFQWSIGMPDPEDNVTYVDGWTTFTDSTVVLLDGDQTIKVREVFPEGYIPFTGVGGSNVSAEIWCYNDIRNYDNNDWITNPQAGETYYCVAWNVEEQTQCVSALDFVDPTGAPIPDEQHLLGDATVFTSHYLPAFGTSEGDPDYDELADVVDDGIINGADYLCANKYYSTALYECPIQCADLCLSPLDYNEDYFIGVDDATIFTSRYIPALGSQTGDDNFDETVDLNQNGYVDHGDYLCSMQPIAEAKYSCTLNCDAVCGDLTVQKRLGEECDDGNDVDGDGCSATCTIENDEPSICGLKFYDYDQNGEMDGDDSALAGWEITLSEKLDCREGSEWADTVVDFSQGLKKDGSAVSGDRSDETDALGVAESDGSDYDNPVVAGSFFSLGFGGSIVLSFDNLIENGSGDDLQLFEVTGGSSYPDENVKVEASQDGINWTELVASVTRDATIDLGPLDWAQYVRITDVSNPANFNNDADGFDLDGVRALNCLALSESTSQRTTENGYCFEPIEPGYYHVCETLQPEWYNSTPICQQVLIEDTEDATVHFGNYQDVAPFCGDGFVNQTSEQCDDGNNTNGDGCDAQCQNEIPEPDTYDFHGYKYDDQDNSGYWGCVLPPDTKQELTTDDSRFVGCEPKLPGWTIFIDENDNGVLDGEEISTTTASTQDEHFGWYWFTGLTAGDYRVCEVQEQGWNQTEPIDPNCYEVTLPVLETAEFTQNAVLGPEYNFGNYYTGYCGDQIRNNDEQCDGSEGVGERQYCTESCELRNEETPVTPSGGGGGGGGGSLGLTVFNETNEIVSAPNSQVSWFTNRNATCNVVYGVASQDGTSSSVNMGYNSMVSESLPGGTFHTAELLDIDTNTTYYWRPDCTSGYGDKYGIELAFAIPEDTPTVLGVEIDEEEPQVLGFDELPETGGEMSDYYFVVLALYSLLVAGLYLGYRKLRLN